MTVSPDIRTPVIVLNWNRWDDTFACVRSILGASPACNIWVVDNGSDEDRGAQLRRACPQVRTLRWDRNHGWAGGYNRALRVALSEGRSHAYLLNNDCAVMPGFLETVLAVADSSRVASVGSRIVSRDWPLSVLFDGESHTPNTHELRESSAVREVSVTLGAGMLINLRCWSTVGPFDDRYFCYYEEVEWCWRARRQGWTLLVADGSLVAHGGEASDVNHNSAYYQTRNYVLFLSQALGCSLASPAVIRHVYLAIRGANEARRLGDLERGHAIAAGILDGLAGRYGQRGPDPNRAAVVALCHCWPLPSGSIRRALEDMRNLTPGRLHIGR